MAPPAKGWPNDASYIAGKFREVADALETGDDSIVECLRNVCQSRLFVIHDVDFPDSLLPEWKDIRGRLTMIKDDEGAAVKRGSFNLTLDAMSEEDAANLAQRIVILAREYQYAAAATRS